MNLETWLRQNRPQGEQLGVIEALCTALNEAHVRGVVHPAIEPSNIDLLPDGRVSLAEAVHGVASTSGSRYRAPEVAEGAPHSAPADIYAAGVIFYEMLAGHSVAGGDRVAPLSDSRPDLSRDLTDAVMGCLERGPDWRPRDLGYLLQVVAQVRGSSPSHTASTRSSRPEPAKPTPSPSARSTTRATSRSRSDSDLPLSAGRDAGGRSSLPMILVAIIVLAGGGAGAWLWLQSQGSTPTNAPRARASVTPPPATAVPAQATASPTPGNIATQSQTAQASLPTATPLPPGATPSPSALAAMPTPTPVPVVLATPVAIPISTPAAPATTAPTAGPVARPTTTPSSPPPQVAAVEPPVLTAVTPLTLKRGGQAMIDIRGIALRSDLQIRIVHLKEKGVAVPIRRVKWVDATIAKALVDMDANLPTGQYSVTIVDPQGTVTNALIITITK